MTQRRRMGTGASVTGRADSSLTSAFAVVVVAGIAAYATRDVREARHGTPRVHDASSAPAPTNRPRAADVPPSYVAPPAETAPQGVEASLRADPRWNEVEFALVARPPFVTARGVVPAAGTDWSDEARAVAARDTAIAHAVHAHWTDCFGPLPPPAAPGRETFLRVILPDIARFALAYQREERTLLEPDLGTFCAADGTAYIVRRPGEGTQPIPCGESEMQAVPDCHAAAVTAAQLLVVARARTPQAGPATRSRAFWFERGLLAWLGGVETARGDPERDDPGPVSANRLQLETIRHIRGSGRARADDGFRDAARLWTIPRLLDVRSDEDVFRVVGVSDGPPVHRWVMWGFVHFLWNYDGGRYRETLRSTLAADLRGEDATAAFRSAIGAIDPATVRGDWTAVQREFSWYWDKLLARGVGWKSPAQQDWWQTPTTPPVGRWAPPPPDEAEAKDEAEQTAAPDDPADDR